MEDTKNTNVGLAVMAGLAVGAAVWYFMNTKDGKQQWETLVNVTKDFTDKLKKNASDTSKSIANHAVDQASLLKDGIHN